MAHLRNIPLPMILRNLYTFWWSLGFRICLLTQWSWKSGKPYVRPHSSNCDHKVCGDVLLKPFGMCSFTGGPSNVFPNFRRVGILRDHNMDPENAKQVSCPSNMALQQVTLSPKIPNPRTSAPSPKRTCRDIYVFSVNLCRVPD